jgi:molybdopterin molybdotransferase
MEGGGVMETMVSVTEAREKILQHVAPGAVQVLPLSSVLGMVLAASVRAQVDVPAFDNSAMDGFALDHRVTASATPATPVRLPIAGFQAAGKVAFGSLKPGRALRIGTGAYIPLDVTAVVPLEEVREDNGDIVITAPVQEGAHIRRRAEETRCGDAVLDAGVRLNAPVLGYLTSIGVCEVPVHARPRVGIVPTGTELVPLGGALGPGQIYDSNSVMLAAALQTDGISARAYPPLRDDADLQRVAIAKVMDENDIVIITGGVSVGHHDHVKDILAAQDVTPLFWRVRQKPGKPLFVGVRGDQMVFGLPGNPASSLISYYEYVRPALRKAMGHCGWTMDERRMPCTSALNKESGKTHFLRGRITCDNGQWQVTPCRGQGSHSLHSFAEANAVIVLPEETMHITAGEEVWVHALP